MQTGQRPFWVKGVARDEEMAVLETGEQQTEKGARFFARSGNVLRKRPEVKYRVIDRCREAYLGSA